MSGSPVKLFAYKMDTANFALALASSSSQNQQGQPLAWHLSVSVFGFEYTYGSDGKQILKKADKDPTEEVPMGCTEKTMEELENYLDSMNDWTASTYKVLQHNCQGFAKLILRFLKIKKPIPRRYLLPEKLSKNLENVVNAVSSLCESSGNTIPRRSRSPISKVKNQS